MRQLQEDLKKWEGRDLFIYYLDDVPHIGYGHNLKNGIPEKVAQLLLDLDATQAINDVMSIPEIAEQVKAMGDVRFNALVHSMFNMGKPRFQTFHKMIKAIGKGDWSTAADELLDSRFRRKLPRRAEWLAKKLRTGG